MSRNRLQGPLGGAMKLDRRARQRYPIRMSLWGRILRNGGATILGETVDISSEGILFATDGRIPVNERVELRLQWPATSPNLEALELYVFATVIRSADHRAAARIWSHQLRPISSAPGETASAAAGAALSARSIFPPHKPS